MRIVSLAVVLAGCAADPTGGMDTSTAAGSDAESTAPPASSEASGTTVGSVSDPDSSEAGSTAADESTGEFVGVLVAARFTIPAGTVVEEFSYEADGIAPFGTTAGRTVVVAIRDVTHTRRDQDALCPGSHPLDGCATVDYGAFGTPHDNRLIVEGGDGPLELHLHKNREIFGVTEPLPISE